MRRIHWFPLLLLFVFLLKTDFLDAQESKIVPGRPIVAPRFDVDVLVNGDALQECEGRGGTYVEALWNQEYEIRLRNGSNERVAVALYVDGLNSIDSRRSPPENSPKWMIEPYQTITISGWQTDSDYAQRFYFTTIRDSYAAKLGVYGTQGVIWAAFYRERRRRPIPIVPPRPPYPTPRSSSRDDGQSSADMRSAAEGPTTGTANKSRARDEAGTGIGRTVRHDVEYIDMDLESRPTAEVTIRYNYGPIYESNPKYRVRDKRDN